MNMISVCVCTFRRQSLERTLMSIARQILPDGVTAELIVVDNDGEGSARAMVQRLARVLPFDVTYSVEPRKGLSFARNHALAVAAGSWLALIDDDATAAPDWLAQLYHCAHRFHADAVIGAVRPAFEEPPPEWLVRSRFFESQFATPRTGARVAFGEARTGNAFLRAGFVRAHQLKFDSRFNFTGGEDSDFFQRFARCGGSITSCQEAVVSESIQGDRIQKRYVTQKSLHAGELYARITHKSGGTRALVMGIPRAGVNVVAAALITSVCYLLGSGAYHRYYFLLLRNLGKFRYYFGFAPIEMYQPSNEELVPL